MRIAITGADGQLGQALRQRFGAEHDVVALNRTALDLDSPASIDQLVATGAELVLHPAAYTNVDGCARDPMQAYRTNTLGTQYVALACRRLGAPLVHISTNEVFDGTAERPYVEYDRANPVNPYGWSKWMAEQVVRERLPEHYIVRVAWLYGGARNFVRTVLRLAAERPELAMVADEVGSPTYTPDVADAVAALIQTGCYGTYHIVNEGSTSRYAFAQEIVRLAGSNTHLRSIALAEFKRDSVVPPRTPLHNAAAAALGIQLRPWQDAVATFVGQIQQEQAQPTP